MGYNFLKKNLALTQLVGLDILKSQTNVISRAVFLASKNKTSNWISEKSVYIP
jgi:phosphoribosyl-dephospho-CoA transferase